MFSSPTTTTTTLCLVLSVLLALLLPLTPTLAMVQLRGHGIGSGNVRMHSTARYLQPDLTRSDEPLRRAVDASRQTARHEASYDRRVARTDRHDMRTGIAASMQTARHEALTHRSRGGLNDQALNHGMAASIDSARRGNAEKNYRNYANDKALGEGIANSLRDTNRKQRASDDANDRALEMAIALSRAEADKNSKMHASSKAMDDDALRRGIEASLAFNSDDDEDARFGSLNLGATVKNLNRGAVRKEGNFDNYFGRGATGSRSSSKASGGVSDGGKDWQVNPLKMKLGSQKQIWRNDKSVAPGASASISSRSSSLSSASSEEEEDDDDDFAIGSLSALKMPANMRVVKDAKDLEQVQGFHNTDVFRDDQSSTKSQ